MKSEQLSEELAYDEYIKTTFDFAENMDLSALSKSDGTKEINKENKGKVS